MIVKTEFINFLFQLMKTVFVRCSFGRECYNHNDDEMHWVFSFVILFSAFFVEMFLVNEWHFSFGYSVCCFFYCLHACKIRCFVAFLCMIFRWSFLLVFRFFILSLGFIHFLIYFIAFELPGRIHDKENERKKLPNLNNVLHA